MPKLISSKPSCWCCERFSNWARYRARKAKSPLNTGPARARFAAGLAAVLRVDELINGGRHREEIPACFNWRAIGPARPVPYRAGWLNVLLD